MWVTDPTTGKHSCTQEKTVCQGCCGDYIDTAEECAACVQKVCSAGNYPSSGTDNCTDAIAGIDAGNYDRA